MPKQRGRRKNEDLIKLVEVPKLLLELTGVTRGRATIHHWVTYGRLNYTGEIIKLKSTKRLGRSYTTRVWVEDFIREIG